MASFDTTSTKGTVLHQGNGVFSYDPKGLFNDLDSGEFFNDSFSYTVSDGAGGLSNSATVFIRVAGVNDAPQAFNDAISVGIGGTATTLSDGQDSVLSNDVDVDETEASITAQLEPGIENNVRNGALTLNANGSFSYTHDGSNNLTDSFSYRAFDQTDTSNPATVSIVISNTAPVANDDVVPTSVDEGSVITLNVLANDEIGESASTGLLVESISLISNGSVKINSDQTISFTHDGSETSSAGFRYTVSNGFRTSNAATVSFDVNPVNDAPLITQGVSIDQGVEEDGTLLISLDATDAEDDPLSWSIVPHSLNASIGITATTGSAVVSYTPQANFTGLESFRVEVKDDSLASAIIQLNIEVAAVNDPPIFTEASPVSVEMNEDDPGSFSLQLNASDADNDVISWSIPALGQASHGIAAVTGTGVSKQILYTPNADYNGPDSFNVQISANAQTASIRIDVTVNPQDDAPLISGVELLNLSMLEDGDPLAFELAASDVDGGDPSWEVITTNTVGSLSISGSGASRQFIYTPNPDQNGNDSFNVKVTDAGGLSDSVTLVVTIDAVNDAPVILAGANIRIDMSEDASPNPFDLLLTAFDAEDEALSWGLLSQASHGVAALAAIATGSTQVISYTPAADFNGTDRFDISVTSGTQTASTQIEVVVLPVNDAPLLSAIDNPSIEESTPFSLALTVTDVDDLNDGSGAILWSFVSGQESGMTLSTTGEFGWTAPQTGAFGQPYGPIVITAADGGEDAATAASLSFSITVNAPDADGDQIADYDDFCPTVADSTNADSDGDGTAGSDLDASDDIGGDACDSDDDNDGLSDEVEIANNLDPLDASDAARDADGDGISNIDEIRAGSNPLTADITIDASGHFTPYLLTAPNPALLHKDATRVSANLTGPWRPGRQLVTWLAANLQNSSLATTEQVLNVRPLIGFGADRVVVEGGQVTVRLHLNGKAASYPVEVSYSVSGTADESDHDAVAGSLQIADGEQSAEIEFNLLADSITDPDETILFSIDSVSNAVMGSRSRLRLTVSEQNEAPDLAIQFMQKGQPISSGYVGDDDVTVTALVSDKNSGQSHSLDWTSSDNALLPPTDPSISSWTFTPIAGVYRVELRVSDDGQPVRQSSAKRLLKIFATPPPTLTAIDSDGDGLNDDVEGYQDKDFDGIPEYRDTQQEPHLLPDQSEVLDASNLLQTENGLKLSVGNTALAAGIFGASVTDETIADFGSDSGQSPLNAQDEFEHVSGVYDFEISQLNPGDSALLVIPLQSAIPKNGVYRKFDEATGWTDFVVDGVKNIIYSAAGPSAACPEPGSSAYQPGLGYLHSCLQLLIEDGGPNDQDGEVNGVIRDPGSIGLKLSKPVTPTVEQGGRLSIGFLFALWFLALLRRRFNQNAVHDE